MAEPFRNGRFYLGFCAGFGGFALSFGGRLILSADLKTDPPEVPLEICIGMLAIGVLSTAVGAVLLATCPPLGKDEEIAAQLMLPVIPRGIAHATNYLGALLRGPHATVCSVLLMAFGVSCLALAWNCISRGYYRINDPETVLEFAWFLLLNLGVSSLCLALIPAFRSEPPTETGQDSAVST